MRRNGELRNPTTIWVVRAGGRARIRAGGVERDVAVEEAGDAVLDEVDAGYRVKYGRYASIVDSINDAEHRTTTLRLAPLDLREERNA